MGTNPSVPSSVQVLGIRHHGPGSARSVRWALEELNPDCVLVEGPPDGEAVLPLLAHKEMKPPVAMLIYVPDEPRKAVYYPFAVFSPEWQAIEYALERKISVRFMDLPHWHQLAIQPEFEVAQGRSLDPDKPPSPNLEPSQLKTPEESDSQSSVVSPWSSPPLPTPEQLRRDPLQCLAEAAGYSDGERWWEHMVEERQGSREVFDAILEAMSAVRDSIGALNSDPDEQLRESRREAYMRQTIRAAQKEGFKNIAVVCGAWHAPVLAKMPATASQDADTLKGLPKVKTAATWVPWTYGHLTYASGYGAGITSPGWYHHLWDHFAHDHDRTGSAVTISWMTRVARLLRDEDLDASSASVIESVRLAESLAGFRGRPLPGLQEMNEASQTVFCFGSDVPMKLIHQRLIVSQRLGEVPEETPAVPLQQDLAREQKRLRFPPEASDKVVDLDLRKPNDLDRSRLLHRLNVLGIGWGMLEREGMGKGTFHEIWRVEWKPELSIKVVEAAVWGNTVVDAATGVAKHAADHAPNLPALTTLLDAVILADLHDAAAYLMGRLEAQSALATDVAHLMAALPPLAHIVRYGNVRKTDVGMIGHVLDGLVARICIGLPPATASLNDEAAVAMYERILAVNASLATLQNEGYTRDWQQLLERLADQQNLHGLLAGRAVRLLLDVGRYTSEQAAQRLSLALSKAAEPAQAAAWIEGFLKGSGQLLLHDGRLWRVIEDWLAQLNGDVFTQLLPLLRRTFSTFPAPERRQMGQRAARGATMAAEKKSDQSDDVDEQRAQRVLPILAHLLGV